VAIRPAHHQVYASPAHHQVAVSLSASGTPINFNTLLTQALPRLTSPAGHQLVTAAGSLMASGCQSTPLVSPQSAATGPASLQPQGSVTMVYGLNCQKMSCTRVFNLFCLYGNVVRVKFLKTKEGCAMVQMGDTLAVERAVSNLNNMTFFESKMQLGFSKQAFLADVQQPYELPDGTPSFMDFMGNKNNRFINPEMASKNRIQPPSKILHFFNTPPGQEASDIEELFLRQGAPKPKCVKMFPSKTDRSSSGLIEFETLAHALESLVVANHVPVENPSGKFPYIMKLCFSSSKAIPVIIH
jgi:heterogeneous nuclear ribonucleoprotein L